MGPGFTRIRRGFGDRGVGPIQVTTSPQSYPCRSVFHPWLNEDEIRGCERTGDFGPKFVELARSVYHNNDHRAALKRLINVLLGSKIIEEKSYAGDPD
jgi:hypothetical protein